MREAEVFYNGELAGFLTETDQRTYLFEYEEEYFKNAAKPKVSLTLPKTQKKYQSDYLFPFFFHLIAEGTNLSLQSRNLKIDKKDHFGILCATAHTDTIGPITVRAK